MTYIPSPARYDGMISNYLTSLDEDKKATKQFPEVLNRQWVKVQDMRYGENPHQQAAFYRERLVAPGLLAGYTQLHGKELSYNNIADTDAAWDAARSVSTPACVIIKHANPCGGRLPEGLQDRLEVRLRRHHRLQPRGRPRNGLRSEQAVRRSRDRPVLYR